ncbi:lipase family protein [Acidovorax cavernicola]|nr:lipase family protein [Acidovorax cavernicola]
MNRLMNLPLACRIRSLGRMLGRWMAALMLCLGVSAAAVAGPLQDPATDAFYAPPSPLPEGPHGTLIRSRPYVPLGLPAWGWQIMYKSTDVNGNPIAVTGNVMVPWLPWFQSSPRPIIGWASGTQGVADRCAPSHQLAIGTEYEAIAGPIGWTLARGWAIAMTDYQGLGTPGDHPYGVAAPTGRAMLDAVIAAQQLGGANLSVQAPVGLVGYSQGGHASAVAAELQPSYAPALKVKGVASGAGPSSVDGLYAAHNGGLFGGAIPYLMVGLNAAYPELNLDGILTAYGKSVMAEARNNKCLLAMAASYPGLSDAVMVDGPGILDRPDWKARFQQQRTGTATPAAPALIYAGLLDEIVPYENTKKTFTAWCAGGAKVSFRTIGITEHATGMLLGYPIALDWMADRFAGNPAPSNCP